MDPSAVREPARGIPVRDPHRPYRRRSSRRVPPCCLETEPARAGIRGLRWRSYRGLHGESRGAGKGVGRAHGFHRVAEDAVLLHAGQPRHLERDHAEDVREDVRRPLLRVPLQERPLPVPGQPGVVGGRNRAGQGTGRVGPRRNREERRRTVDAGSHAPAAMGVRGRRHAHGAKRNRIGVRDGVRPDRGGSRESPLHGIRRPLPPVRESCPE